MIDDKYDRLEKRLDALANRVADDERVFDSVCFKVLERLSSKVAEDAIWAKREVTWIKHWISYLDQEILCLRGEKSPMRESTMVGSGPDRSEK